MQKSAELTTVYAQLTPNGLTSEVFERLLELGNLTPVQIKWAIV